MAAVFQALTPAVARNVSSETNSVSNTNTGSGGGGGGGGTGKRRRRRRGGRRNRT